MGKPLREFAEEKAEIPEPDAIATLQRAGYIVHKPQPSEKIVQLDVDRIRGNRFRLGIVSDLHLGSKFQQPTLLREHVRYMRRRGVRTILLPGDVTDGSTAMHPGFEYELWAHGADAQIDAAIEGIPAVRGIEYVTIPGNHDGSHWKADGVDVVRRICQQRDDMTYLGPDEIGNARMSVGYVKLGDVLIQLCHPHLGGTRTRSYRMERWVEELQPERKPNVVVMGNFHKVLQLDYRNVFGLMVPAFQAQTSWMASKGISSYVGSCILEFGTEPKGLAPSITVEWLIERVPYMDDFPGGRRR